MYHGDPNSNLHRNRLNSLLIDSQSQSQPRPHPLECHRLWDCDLPSSNVYPPPGMNHSQSHIPSSDVDNMVWSLWGQTSCWILSPFRGIHSPDLYPAVWIFGLMVRLCWWWCWQPVFWGRWKVWLWVMSVWDLLKFRIRIAYPSSLLGLGCHCFWLTGSVSRSASHRQGGILVCGWSDTPQVPPWRISFSLMVSPHESIHWLADHCVFCPFLFPISLHIWWPALNSHDLQNTHLSQFVSPFVQSLTGYYYMDSPH